jgi:hypothetical protein
MSGPAVARSGTAGTFPAAGGGLAAPLAGELGAGTGLGLCEHKRMTGGTLGVTAKRPPSSLCSPLITSPAD